MSRLRLLLPRSPEQLSANAQIGLAVGGALPQYKEFLNVPSIRSLDDVECRLKQLEVCRSDRPSPYGVYDPDLEVPLSIENKRDERTSWAERKEKCEKRI
uniref:Uncharacterized protein n=1 Tax=Cacopsylla melanoneura TaxID=428564 RepID=A0A8D8RE60_9HEMI